MRRVTLVAWESNHIFRMVVAHVTVTPEGLAGSRAKNSLVQVPAKNAIKQRPRANDTFAISAAAVCLDLLTNVVT